MARLALEISDPATRLTLRAILEREGHTFSDDDPELSIADTLGGAVAAALDRPSLMVATQQQLEEAVAAMAQGVYGYIFLPFVPGEAPLMVARALANPGSTPAPEPVYEPVSLAEAERRHIEETLRHCRNNQARAARLLGIGRNTLWRKRKGAQEPAPDPEAP